MLSRRDLEYTLDPLRAFGICARASSVVHLRKGKIDDAGTSSRSSRVGKTLPLQPGQPCGRLPAQTQDTRRNARRAFTSLFLLFGTSRSFAIIAGMIGAPEAAKVAGLEVPSQGRSVGSRAGCRSALGRVPHSRAGSVGAAEENVARGSGTRVGHAPQVGGASKDGESLWRRY